MLSLEDGFSSSLSLIEGVSSVSLVEGVGFSVPLSLGVVSEVVLSATEELDEVLLEEFEDPAEQPPKHVKVKNVVASKAMIPVFLFFIFTSLKIFISVDTFPILMYIYYNLSGGGKQYT